MAPSNGTDTSSLAQTMLSTPLVEPTEEPLDLGGYLAELHLPDDYVAAWVAVNDGTCAQGAAVAAAAALLQAGCSSIAFYPFNVNTDRQPLVLMHFTVFGVAGAFVIQEPWIDPIGFSARP